MRKRIILSAFGTSTAAKATYERLEHDISIRFPDAELVWYYTSPTIRAKSSPQQGKDQSLGDLLAADQTAHTVVQSLHIIPGYEFHRLVKEATKSTAPVSIGYPLLTSPDDFKRVAGCLKPLIQVEPGTATLLLGHGTSHPTWTSYIALAQILRELAGDSIFVAALEKYPLSEKLFAQISQGGYQRIFIIPFLLVAGMHFFRDIDSPREDSWTSKLKSRDIDISCHRQGLGYLPGIAEIFCDHIDSAFKSQEGPAQIV